MRAEGIGQRAEGRGQRAEGREQRAWGMEDGERRTEEWLPGITRMLIASVKPGVKNGIEGAYRHPMFEIDNCGTWMEGM